MAARRRAVRSAWLAAALLAAGCTGAGAGVGAADADHAHAGADPAVIGHIHRQFARVLEATWTGYQLPFAATGMAAVADGRRILLAGGRTGGGTALRAVTSLDPVTGRTRPLPDLPVPVSDAAAALTPAGSLAVFGGTAKRPVQQVQAPGTRKAAGVLPQGRSGLVAVTAGRTTYLIGGSDAARAGTVLATTAGTRFAVVARLPVPVAYPAAAAVAGQLWVAGGLTAAGPSRAIQVIDLRTGHARLAGRLPRPLSAASAFVLGGRMFVAGGQTSSPAAVRHREAVTSAVLRIDTASGTAVAAGAMPMPLAHAAAAVVDGTAYLAGGTNGTGAVPQVTAIRLAPASQVPVWGGPPGASHGAAGSAAAPWDGPVRGPGHLAKGSRPSALPADVLVADHLNNRLVVIDPQGRVRWVFPRPGDLRHGQTFRVPDDAFFSPDGRYIIATQEDDQVISVIDVATRRIVYRYGVPGHPGTGPDHVDNPDDALLTPAGHIVAADIKNCRLIVVAPPAHRPMKVIGMTTNVCWHDPPYRFGSPNGAFPLSTGGYVVTEINGDWADGLTKSGRIAWAVNPPGVLYPSDTNEVYPGRLLTADYSDPGQVVEFSPRGKLLWRFGGLNQPSLALPLPNGDILVNDDFNNRIIVIDPATNRIVWQYGHTGVAGRAPGYLNDPDGLDLVPPGSLLIRHAPTMTEP